MPSRSEQKIILKYIWDTTQPIDIATAKAIDEIGLLREYRTRLIADVVTGKRDVRGATASLRDETGGADEGEEIEEVSDAESAEDDSGDVHEEAAA